MRSKTKIAIMIALVLAAIGLVISVAGLIALRFNFNFKELDTMNYTKTVHDITKPFDKISIDVSVADITFVPSSSDKITVTADDSEKLKHTVLVDETGTLSIVSYDTRKWFVFDVAWTSPKIIVSIPSELVYSELNVVQSTGSLDLPAAFSFDRISVHKTTGSVQCDAHCNGSLEIKTSTGSIRVSNTAAENVSLTSTTGSIRASSIEVENTLSLCATTGSIKLSDIQCQALTATTTTGSISLTGCHASRSVELTATTGSINGDLAGSYNYIADATTGSVHVPDSDPSAPVCRIKTTTGSINIKNKS